MHAWRHAKIFNNCAKCLPESVFNLLILSVAGIAQICGSIRAPTPVNDKLGISLKMFEAFYSLPRAGMPVIDVMSSNSDNLYVYACAPV